MYPTREIIQLNVDAIAAGGGDVFCVTQQEPLSDFE
jgi:agmatine deiminase